MTDSWTPTKTVIDSITSSLHHVHPHLELDLFRDYYQSQPETLVLTQAAWDRKFRSWCSRAERRWLDEHQDQTVRFDEVTGMPINPKPITYAPGERP